MIRRSWIGLAALGLLLSMGSPEPASWVGRIAAKGHEPFVFLALIDEQGREWRLEGQAMTPLWEQAQGRWVRVAGKQTAAKTILVESWTWIPDREAP